MATEDFTPSIQIIDGKRYFVPVPGSGHRVDDPVVIPNLKGVSMSSRDVISALRYVSASYPELEAAMDAGVNMIIHLEGLRHEAILPIGLGRIEEAKALLKQAAVVVACQAEVSHV